MVNPPLAVTCFLSFWREVIQIPKGWGCAFFLATFSPWKLETSILLAVALLPVASPDIKTLPSMALIFWTPVLTLPETCQEVGKTIKNIPLSISGQLGQSPSTCATQKADLVWVLAVSPPHRFRSKSSHSTESKDTIPSIISFHTSNLLSKWILKESLPSNLPFDLELVVYGCLDLNSHFQLLYPFNMFSIFKSFKNASHIARWNSAWSWVLVPLLSYIILGNSQVSGSSKMSFCFFPKGVEDQNVLNAMMSYTNMITPVTFLW